MTSNPSGESTVRYYELYGCLLATDLDLNLPETALRGREPDVVMQRTDQPIDTEWPPSADALVQGRSEEGGIVDFAVSTADGPRIRVDGVCQFDLSPDLSRVGWRVAPGADPGMVAILTAGMLMAFRMALAGALVLHSSAVLARGRGLAFVGASGMGKSTMATLLCAAGATMITDDVGRIDFSGVAPAIWPGGGESRLRPAAASLRHLFDDSAASARPTSDGRTALLLPRLTGEPTPLDAIVVPLPSRDHDKLLIAQIEPARALILLGYFPRIPGWVDSSVRARQFNLLADLLDRVPVYQAVVPWGPPFNADTGSELLDELGWS